VAERVVQTLSEGRLERDLLLNVNVPNIPADDIQGIQITRQGMRIYHSALDKRQDPRGKAYYWIAGSVPSGVPDFGTDFGAIAENNVSITPLKVDLTDFGRSMQLRQWNWDRFERPSPAMTTNIGISHLQQSSAT
jgi:5'-nucleotidase